MAKKIAVVVQRYGKGVLGGSESLARDIASGISGDFDVEVLTTCAAEYDTWKNEFPDGETKEDGITVRRFKVDSPRHALFAPYGFLIRHLPRSRGMEERWMRMQGPYSSGLIDHVSGHKADYSLFIFITYLYCTTYYCLPYVKEKAMLVPTAHDEPYIRYSIFREVFESPLTLAYLTEEEKAFVEGLFCVGEKGAVIGAPIKTVEGSAGAFRKKYGVEGDFILYAGRLERMKGLDMLLDYFRKYSAGKDIRLVLCGSGPMKIPDTEGVIPVGYLDEQDKAGAMMAAMATCVPSPYESFSYSLLESLSYGTPVIVNEKCMVLKGHVERSGGGMSFKDYESFARAVDLLGNDPGRRRSMGDSGREYALGRYSPAEIRKRYLSLVYSLISDEHQEHLGL